MSGMGEIEPIYRADAITEGVDDYRLRRMCGTGEVQRLRPVAYAEPAELEGLFPEERHSIEIMATARALRRPAVVSHASAAVMHGLPMWNVDPRRAHFTRVGTEGGFSTTRSLMHIARLVDDEIVRIDGLP